MVNKLFLDKVKESFFITPMDLLHLFVLLFTCSLYQVWSLKLTQMLLAICSLDIIVIKL